MYEIIAVGRVEALVREYVFIVFTFHLVLVCFLFSFFSHFHEDITNLTEITCARRVAAGPGRVRVKSLSQLQLQTLCTQARHAWVCSVGRAACAVRHWPSLPMRVSDSCRGAITFVFVFVL